MPRTQTQLRKLTAREVGLDIFRTGTFDGSGGTISEQGDTALKVLADNQAIGAWIYTTDGADKGTDFQVTDSVQSTGRLVFRPDATAAMDGDVYELLPFRATTFHNAINDAIVDLSARHVLERIFWTYGIVVGSPGMNADFAYWTSTNQPFGYTVNSGTVVKQRTYFVGPSAQCMIIQAGVVEVNTAFARYFLDYYNEDVTMYCWVWSDAPTETRIGINLDGTTTWSDYHSGDSAPELLSVKVSVGTALNTFIPTFANTGNEGYFSDWFLSSSRKAVEHPWPFDYAPEGPIEIYELQQDETNNDNPLVRHARRRDTQPINFDYHVSETSFSYTFAWLSGITVPQGRRLLIKTAGPLTQLSADTDSVEVTERQGTLVAKTAAVRILIDYRNRVNPTLAQQVTERIARLQSQIDVLEVEVTTNDHAVDLPYRW